MPVLAVSYPSKLPYNTVQNLKHPIELFLHYKYPDTAAYFHELPDVPMGFTDFHQLPQVSVNPLTSISFNRLLPISVFFTSFHVFPLNTPVGSH